MASSVTILCVLFFLFVSRPAIGKHLKAVSHYTYFAGNPTPRWPVGQTNLTYAFASNFSDSFVSPVVSAFDEWASGSGYFTFYRVDDIGTSDLKISFQRMNHGDATDFDGPNGKLAHSYAPTDGRLHFDADENWSTGPGPVPNTYDFKSVALHEIGHLLGLGHSNDSNALMYATMISSGTVKDTLTSDDIQGIKDLYGHKGNATPRWPVGKTDLTYGLDLYFPDSFVPLVVSAFDEWASGSGYFTFSRGADIGASDLKISFQKMNHGDTGDFDGPGGILAHGFQPPDGRLHFDADEIWSLGPRPVPNVIDFKSVALHEIGHLLGLGHSQYQDAVMWESLPLGTVKDKLTSDDIQRIKVLYGLN